MQTEPLFDYYNIHLTGDVVSNAKSSGSPDNDDDYYYEDDYPNEAND
jgi:hypothetical protein